MAFQQLLAAALLLVPTMALAQPATVLSVKGEVSQTVTLRKGQSVALAFYLDKAMENVSVNLTKTTCLGCFGTVMLNKGSVGPTSTLKDSIKASSFAHNDKPAPAITAPALTPGLYYVVLSVEGGSLIVGGSGARPTVEAKDARRGLDFLTMNTNVYPPKSNFKAQLASGLHYTVKAGR
jgi:hypothetical protein